MHRSFWLRSLVLLGLETLCFAQTQLPVVSKSFRVNPVQPGSATRVSFTVTNPNSSTIVSNITFTDVVQAGFTLVFSPVFTACPIGSSFGFNNATQTMTVGVPTLAPGGSCTISTEIRTPSAITTWNNATSAVTSSAGPGAPATATLRVGLPPVLSKTFEPSTIAVGASSILTFTISNPNSSAPLNSVGFTDNLPAGLQVTNPAELTGSCGGSSGVLPGGETVVLTGATVPAGANCTLSVPVTGVHRSKDQCHHFSYFERR